MPHPALPAALLCGALITALPAPAEPAPVTATAAAPRQVILLVGDGMDEQQLTIARNYLHGARGQLLVDSLPLRAAVQVLTVTDSEDGAPVYVADSANTATSLATGAVTSIGRIGTAPGSGADLTNIVELAAAAGLRTGIVTTASVTDATPAAFATHINFRLCENPGSMVDVNYKGIPLGDCAAHLQSRGGRGSIAEQLAAAPLDVLLGGGRKHFSAAVEGGGQSVLALSRARGYTVVEDTGALAAVPPGQRLLGLFAAGTLPVRLQGEGGRGAEDPRPSLLNRVHPYLGDVTLPEPVHCEPNPEFDGVPGLAQMTDAALARLAADNDRGFFLMVESASIDKQSHERKPCGAIGEVQQLEEALASALAFAGSHPQTLVLVTSDHAHAAQLVPDSSLYAAYPIPIYTPGKLARVRSPEGAVLAVNYATSNFMQEEHTGAAVPLYSNAEGVGRVPAFLQQPAVFDIVRAYLGL